MADLGATWLLHSITTHEHQMIWFWGEEMVDLGGLGRSGSATSIIGLCICRPARGGYCSHNYNWPTGGGAGVVERIWNNVLYLYKRPFCFCFPIPKKLKKVQCRPGILYTWCHGICLKQWSLVSLKQGIQTSHLQSPVWCGVLIFDQMDPVVTQPQSTHLCFWPDRTGKSNCDWIYYWVRIFSTNYYYYYFV